MFNNKNNNDLTHLGTTSLGKLLWQYSLPSVVGMMVMSLYNVIDRIFIGQGVGPEAIAGLAITFPVMNVSAAFGVLVGAGASARTSIVLGQNRVDEAERVLGNSLVLNLLFGSLYIGMFALFLDPVLRLFGASEVTLPYAHRYLVWLLPGMLMINTTYSFNNVMRSSGYPNKAMVTMFIGAILNVVLDPIFIFVLDWGIEGAAFASDLSMTVSAAFVMSHFCSKKSNLHFTPGCYKLRRSVVLPILSIGIAPSIVNSAGCVINAVINNTVYAYGGDSNVAAIGIFTSVTQLTITFVMGICLGMQPIIGYNFGAKKYDRLKGVFWLATAVCTLICAGGAAACQLFPAAIARVFSSDPALIQATVHSLRLTTWMFWAVGFQIVSTTFFQSLGEAKMSIFMSITRQVLFIIPLLLVLPRFWQLDGVWLSFPYSDLGATVVTAVLVAVEMRKINKLVKEQPIAAAAA